jgi:hypothetical protein
MAQGFFFAAPMEAAGIDELLRTGPPWAEPVLTRDGGGSRLVTLAS